MLKNEEHIQSFIEEAKIHVETLENRLVSINLDAVDPEEVNAIFRAVHSMKGSAGFFNLNKIVELSHCMESLFGEIRNGKIMIEEEMVDMLLVANDCLKAMIDDVANSENVDIADHVQKISHYLRAEKTPPSINPELSKSKSFFAPNSIADPFEVMRAKREVIADAIRHGHTYYILKAALNEDLIKTGTNPVDLIDTMKSIGEFIDIRTALPEPDNSDEAPVKDVFLEFHFTSVLQKDFLTEVISIPEKNIFEQNIEIEAEDENGTLTDDSPVDEEPETVIAKPLESINSQDPAVSFKSSILAVEDSVRVHVSLLNDLLNLASEMVLGRNQLLRIMEGHRKSISGIDPVLQNIDHITTELQEKVMQTRMQPVSNVFNKFPRLIRELARKLGKEIDLKLEGAEVELDKSIIEAIGDPLTHLIRNAADHGLETSEIREKQGKPRKGTILLKAYHEGGYVNIDVIDDGNGIDIEKIKTRALERGFIHNGDISVMGEQEILQLLFTPGFSTAEKVTDLSGRGVGMDVVKTNIEKLGGTIEVFTTLSKGTTFRLLLPLTLAIIPSLIVQVENQRFALPQVNLQEIVRIKPGQAAQKIEYINNAEVLRLRGGLLPIVHLADVLSLPRTYIDPVSNEKKGEKRKTIFGYQPQYSAQKDRDRKDDDSFKVRNITKVIRILVIKIGSRKLGIAVDAIHGSEEILVKALPSFIKDCRCYSGVTIMGDGKTALILDPEGIISKANLRFNEGNTEKPNLSYEQEIENIREQQNLILFRCSGPETLALDLSMVTRVEEIAPQDIQKIGDKEYINYRQDSLRVIRPEDFLPIGRQNNATNKLYIIIPKLVSNPIGIIIEEIYDTLQKQIILNNVDIADKGLVGSTIINDKIVLLLNLYELFELVDPDNYKTSPIDKYKSAKILVVEDTPFFQEIEKNYLEEAGYQVLLASHGREAWQMLQDIEVDAVVADIQMPVMDGIELVKRIRADKRLANLPVMALTSMTGEQQRIDGLEAGFDMYEFKLDKMRLLEMIGVMLEKRGSIN